ncbi:uncharacterized protein [Rutidosis leptorrhynchoides]|uniref:uncharacterized protein n=1 Tax=Rutidosis leptorrhynchoides TaxID=125765 RepID=UPI003A99799F
MEVLSLMLMRNIRRSKGFKYHPKCDKLKIINLCFADDLFLFSHANSASVTVIRDSLEEFKRCSGLVPSLPKSTAFFANVPSSMKTLILDILPFEEGKLPVLVERVKHKVDDWKNKYLSFAGRLQLMISVLTSMQIYWCFVFILPDTTINKIEKILRDFLWCQGEMKRGKAKVKWDDVCNPKNEGGLGIKRLKYWNIALMTSHIYRILSHKQTLWVKWIHTYRLAKHHFWEVPITANASWSWRKLLRIPSVIKQFFVHQIGNGNITSAWFDSWSNLGSLDSIVSASDIQSMGLTKKVSELISGTNWVWPSSWIVKYPLLSQLSVPTVSTHPDMIMWCGIDNVPHNFLVNLRICPLCKLCPDSHEHLFFECNYANIVWKKMDVLTCLPAVSNWKAICCSMMAAAARNVSSMVVAKLVFGAVMYFIWQERNNRIFKKSHRSEVKLFEDIFSTVRLKLMSIKFKDSARVDMLKSTWQIPS